MYEKTKALSSVYVYIYILHTNAHIYNIEARYTFAHSYWRRQEAISNMEKMWVTNKRDDKYTTNKEAIGIMRYMYTCIYTKKEIYIYIYMFKWTQGVHVLLCIYGTLLPMASKEVIPLELIAEVIEFCHEIHHATLASWTQTTTSNIQDLPRRKFQVYWFCMILYMFTTTNWLRIICLHFGQIGGWLLLKHDWRTNDMRKLRQVYLFHHLYYPFDT